MDNNAFVGQMKLHQVYFAFLKTWNSICHLVAGDETASYDINFIPSWNVLFGVS